MKAAPRGLLLAAAAYAGWGLLGPVGSKLLWVMGPHWLNLVRTALAALVLLVMLALLGRAEVRESLRLARRPAIFALGAMGMGASFTLFAWSLTLVEPVFVTLAFLMTPFWTALWAKVRLGEQVGVWFAPALAALVAGGWLALTGGQSSAWGELSVLGLALAAGSGVTWAYYTVELRVHAPGLPLRPLLLASMLAAVALYAVVAAIEPMPTFSAWPASSWGWLAIYVAVPSLGAFLWFNRALQLAPAVAVNMLVGVELAATAFFAYILLGDAYSWLQVAGMVVVAGAVTLYVWRQPSSQESPTSGTTP